MWVPGEQAGQMNLYEFGTLPIVDGGRTKPIDTFARNTLFAISDRQTFVDENGNSQSAVQWLLDVMSGRLAAPTDPDRAVRAARTPTPAWVDYEVFRISNDQVLNMLGLPERSGFRYSFREIAAGTEENPRKDNLQRLFAAAAKADDREASQRDLYETKVVELARNVVLFRKVLAQQTPLMIPPDATNTEWRSFDDTLLDGGKVDPSTKTAVALNGAIDAYQKGNADAFNAAVADYRSGLGTVVPPADASRVGFETFFNHFEPFYVCAVLYVFVFLLACVGWIGWTATAAPVGVLALRPGAGGPHRGALLAHVPARPADGFRDEPVFVGDLHRLGRRRHRFGRWSTSSATASAPWWPPSSASCRSIVAHNLAAGDTLDVMQAVLDTNFWLATHVTAVTHGLPGHVRRRVHWHRVHPDGRVHQGTRPRRAEDDLRRCSTA